MRNINELEQKVLDILIATAQRVKALDSGSIDYPIAIEELSDCALLLEHGCDSESIGKVINSTTSGELHEALSSMRKFSVTIEEHIGKVFAVYAASLDDAMEIAEDNYNRGEFVVDPTTPTARMMMVVDEATETGTEWKEF